MGRLINTGDLNNRLAMYDGFGDFRGNILYTVGHIIMDCQTATDDAVRDATIDRVLEIIDKVGERFEVGDMDEFEMFTEIRQGVLALKGGEKG